MKKYSSQEGFTLIETIIAIALFSILVTIAIGAFVNALRTQREISSIIGAQSNASLALEQMAREIRTGYLFCHAAGVNTPDAPCSGCVASGLTWSCTNLDFMNANGNEVDYTLNNGALMKSDTSLSGGAQAITGTNVKVGYLHFTLFGNLEGDHWNPRITISLSVAPNSTDPVLVSDTVNIQTSISAREIDCGAAGC